MSQTDAIIEIETLSEPEREKALTRKRVGVSK